MSVGLPAEKPQAEIYRPDLVRLPPLTPGRRFFRWLMKWVCRILVVLLLRWEVKGLENFPVKGPALITLNHLGDTDGVLALAFFPKSVEGIAKIELYNFPVLGSIMQAYGAIWVHRGTPDRKAIRVALQALEEGRLLAIAPEGRESLTGSLEEGTGGAAFLALKTNAPVVPLAFTGTENKRVFGNLKRFRRTRVSMTIGPAFRLEQLPNHREAIRAGTQRIMTALAAQLPPEYRGVYHKDVV